MSDGITYHNKDVISKILSKNFKDKSFKVWGLDLPKIKEVLQTNLPEITARELRLDNVYILEDNCILIIDYESTVKKEDFLKYLRYVLLILEALFAEKNIIYDNVIIAVIYTGDIKKAQSRFKVGCLTLDIRQVFLSKFDTDEMYAELKRKVDNNERLTDEDVMRFIIMPLTEPAAKRKQELIEKTVDLAKRLTDEEQQLFIISGVLVATDKFIDKDYANKIKEWIKMTKVARLFEEEKIEAVNNMKYSIAKNLLIKGVDFITVMECTKLTKSEILEIQQELKLSV